jgi:hypothetical protein
MAKLNANFAFSAVTTTLKTLESILPRENRDYGKDITPVSFFKYANFYCEPFFIEGTPNNRGAITVSFVETAYYRHSLVLCKGF